jgi:RHS repeat-associated protein
MDDSDRLQCKARFPVHPVNPLSSIQSAVGPAKEVALTGGSVLATTTSSYDTTGRPSVVWSANNNSAAHFYIVNSPFADNIFFVRNGVSVMTTQNTYDKVNRLTGKSSVSSAQSVVDSQYTYNGSNAYQKGLYFREQVATTNTNAPQWVGITVTAPGQAANSGHAYVAQTPEKFSYDADGNLTQDGRWTNTWDLAGEIMLAASNEVRSCQTVLICMRTVQSAISRAEENRLISMTSLTNAPTASKYSLALTYDCMGRRIQKIVSTNNGSVYTNSYTNRYLYDGWNLVAIVDQSSTLVASFVWGTDLSGSAQGAGGVGGLISMTVPSGTNAGTYFYSYDGNGNVVALVNAATGAIAANYEYGPFGELIRATGPMAKVNPFLFSTKFYDWESGMHYYGYRYYNPSTGRWLSRDPIEENGGMNLYGFSGNDAIDFLDVHGMEWKINRNSLNARAIAWASSASDTFDDLAKMIGLDTSDYRDWLQTFDTTPSPCKIYGIPNAIYYDMGEYSRWTAVIDYWRLAADVTKTRVESQGFHTLWTEDAKASDIASHLSAPDIYSYIFVGHGNGDQVINTDQSDRGEGVGASRYTLYGIHFMGLYCCGSAATGTGAGRFWKFNEWEANVATRGLFTGFEGDVDLLDMDQELRVTAGTNNDP